MKKIILVLAIIILSFNNSVLFARELYNYDRNEVLEQMSTTSQVRASHILVATEKEAKDLREEMVSGKISFANAAQKYSKCPSGQAGGDLGFFGRGMMVPEFEQASFSLPAGEVSEPIKTQFGWHLIVVTDKK